MSSQLEQLRTYLQALEADRPVVVAWSGGVDSTLVAVVAAQELCERVTIMTVDSEFIARSEVEQVEALGRHLGLVSEIITLELLRDVGIRTNGPDRCYRCKKLIFTALHKQAGSEALILDGTNASDDPQRPGRRALREAGALSPLAECGIDKQGVRAAARELGLPNADRPSNSCLATRIEHQGLDRAALERVESIENHLCSLGFSGVRARLDDLKVIVEVPHESTTLLEQSHDQIKSHVESLGLLLAGYGFRKGE